MITCIIGTQSIYLDILKLIKLNRKATELLADENGCTKNPETTPSDR
ncbi:hypothetical protein [Nostoc sp. ChiVER01]|nr:hypothetical protein [Nostoc sp. ChiVER01]MDZ8222083.1 hypothetical protein [Nostoc sp. ChiVER01]